MMVYGLLNWNYVFVLVGLVLVWGQVQVDWFVVCSLEVCVEIVGWLEVWEVEFQFVLFCCVVICYFVEEFFVVEVERLIDMVGELCD